MIRLPETYSRYSVLQNKIREFLSPTGAGTEFHTYTLTVLHLPITLGIVGI